MQLKDILEESLVPSPLLKELKQLQKEQQSSRKELRQLEN